MTESCLPDRLTPIAAPLLYLSLRAQWLRLALDSAPTRASLLVLLAHWALETGFGHYTHWYNLGNAKHVAGDGQDYCQFRCNEIISGKVVWYDPPDPACSFVAFRDLDAGAAYYLVSLRGRFRIAWPFVLAGDVTGFCHALRLARYYTADEAIYTSGVTRCYHQLDAHIPPDPSERETDPEVADGEHEDPSGPHSA